MAKALHSIPPELPTLLLAIGVGLIFTDLNRRITALEHPTLSPSDTTSVRGWRRW